MIGGMVIFVLCATVVLTSPMIPESKPVPKPLLPVGKLVPTVPKPDVTVPVLPVPTPTSRQECRSANEEFDRILGLANQEFLQKGNISVPVAGFQQYVYLSYSGATLFVKFYIKTSGGSLRMTTAARAGNSIICSESSDDIQSDESDDTPKGQSEETLRGTLQFGEMELQYDKLHAEYFKSSDLDGRLAYKVRPAVNVVVARSSNVCRLVVVNFVDTTRDEYKVTSDSWKDWIVAKLISRSLRDGGDSTPILQYVLDSLKRSLEAHLVKIWCNETAK